MRDQMLHKDCKACTFAFPIQVDMKLQKEREDKLRFIFYKN